MANPHAIASRTLALGMTVMLAVTTACTTVNTTAVRPTPQDTPQKTAYTFDTVNACLSNSFIKPYLAQKDETILFLLGELDDKTKRVLDQTTGALTNAGALIMSDQLSRYGGPRVVLQAVRSEEVDIYVRTGRELGVSDIAKLQRQYGVSRIFLITGGFTEYDQNTTANGDGGTVQVSKDKVAAKFESGTSTETGRTRMVLNIGDPMTNRILGTLNLSGVERRRTALTTATIELFGFGVGGTTQKIEIDGTHSLQANVLAAAHFFIWAGILPGNGEAECLYNPKTSPATFASEQSDYEKASKTGKVRLLQVALNRYFGTSRTPLKVDGMSGPQTIAAVREAERKLNLIPAGPGDFSTLYAHLFSKGLAR